MLVPRFNDMIPTYRSLKIGKKIRFVCLLKGDNITWTFNDGDLPRNAKPNSIGGMDNGLLITNIQPFNAGTYKCLNNIKYIVEIAKGVLAVKSMLMLTLVSLFFISLCYISCYDCLYLSYIMCLTNWY